MVDDLKRVVIVAGAGVPMRMVELLRGQGATVVPQGAHREIAEDEVKIVLGEDKGLWIDEARDITPEMMATLNLGSLTGLDYGLIQTGFHDEHPWSGPRNDPTSYAIACMMGGQRAGKTAAIEDRLDALDYGVLNHAEPDYIYDRMGFRHVRPPVKPRREIEFIDTPKPISRRKARRMRGKKA